jgi:hypothetical protein
MQTKRLFLQSVLALGSFASATAAFAATPIKFQLDWRFEGLRRCFCSLSPRAISRPQG